VVISKEDGGDITGSFTEMTEAGETVLCPRRYHMGAKNELCPSPQVAKGR
jgi:hypothetical protein